MKDEWLDITAPLQAELPHWPGDPKFALRQAASVKQGDEATVSVFTMGTHTGTHVDAPAHYYADAATVDRMPLDATIGPARVIAIRNPQAITAEELVAYDIQPGERLLFKTRNSAWAWTRAEFVQDYVFVAPGAAQLLAERKTRCVGVDYLSVGGFGPAGRETHETLLAAGVWIIEGLDLTAVVPGRYELICLPLRIADSDGAPARAILRPAIV